MYTLPLKILFLTHIIFSGLQGSAKPEAKLVHRFERGSSISSSVEAGEGRLLKSARGVIKGSDGKPISGVLVELFEGQCCKNCL